jgi:hypothetical protein
MRASHNRNRSGFDLLESLALIGALGLIVSPAIRGIAYRWRIRYPAAMSDAAVDEALQKTFPASDPPASRFVDIPVNRKGDE